jgi:hypothetical protein
MELTGAPELTGRRVADAVRWAFPLFVEHESLLWRDTGGEG